MNSDGSGNEMRTGNPLPETDTASTGRQVLGIPGAPSSALDFLAKGVSLVQLSRVKMNHGHHDPAPLEALAAQAKDYALHMMRTTGSVPSTVIAATDDGYLFRMPNALTDDAAKDNFAEAARLFAVAHEAKALVLVVEAWASLPDARGHLDTETPPSESPERKEIVALMLEDHSCCANSLLLIIRDASGTFTAFGDTQPLDFTESAGRFSKLMPRNKPSKEEATQAKTALQSLGMNVLNPGSDPTLN